MLHHQNTNPESTAVRPTPTAGGGRVRGVIFRGAALLMVVVFLALIELMLRGLGIGRPAELPDPLHGFNRQLPLFELQGEIYRTARAHEDFFQHQEFPAVKPTNGFRIFCFGGSTVYGHPYQADTAFPQWLELELSGSDPTRSYQAINCGGISYASYRLAPRVEEVLQYQPDLIVVATGHNEFLEDRTYHSLKARPASWSKLLNTACSLHLFNLARQCFSTQPIKPDAGSIADRSSELAPEVRARLDQESGYGSYHRDPIWHTNVIAQFEESVSAMVASCRATGVPIILVRLGANLRDCPPFKSEHQANLAPESEAKWQQFFDTAASLQSNQPVQALELYQQAARIDSEHALLNYRIARLYDRLGNFNEASSYYAKSRDEDICPLRIISPNAELLNRIATETRTPLVDAEQLLATVSHDSIPGFDRYVDHVHPTISSHQKIARAVAVQIRQAGIITGGSDWSAAARQKAYERHFAQLRPTYFSEGQQRVNWLEHWARRERLMDEVTPQDTRGFVRLGIRQFDLGDTSLAGYTFAKAIKLDRKSFSLVTEYSQSLVSQGRPEAATELAKQLTANGIDLGHL